MGRAAASRRRKPKAMISNTIAKITSTKGPKRNLLIDDSASEDSASVESSPRSRSSDESFIDNDEQEEDSCSPQDLYVAECVQDNPSTNSVRDRRIDYVNKDKDIGHDSYPINEFSLTISKIKGDVHQIAIELLHNFIKETCIKGKFIRLVFKITYYNITVVLYLL